MRNVVHHSRRRMRRDCRRGALVTKSSRMSAFLRVAPLAAAVMLAVAACGGGGGSSSAGSSASASESISPQWQKVIDAAKKEGAVTIYSSQGTDLLQDMGKKFQ